MHPTQRIGCSELRAVKPLWSSISPYVGGVLKTANVELITAEEESVHVSQRVMRCNAVDIGGRCSPVVFSLVLCCRVILLLVEKRRGKPTSKPLSETERQPDTKD